MLLSEDHLAVQDAVRAFVQAEIAPHAAAWEEAGMVSREVWLKAGEQGFLLPWAEEVNRISVEGISEASIAELRNTLLTMIENLVKAEAQAMLADAGTSDAV